MPATWPAGVPYKIRESGASWTEGETSERSDMDSGLARQRKTKTAALDKIGGTIRMTWANYVTFNAFRKSLGGATVNWLGHPSGGTVEVRFVAGEQGPPQKDTATGKWLVPVSLEVMP